MRMRAARRMSSLVVPASLGATLFAARLPAQSPTPSDSALTIEEISFPRGPEAVIGHPFAMLVTLDAAHAGICTSTRWLVTAPDGTTDDIFGGYPEIECAQKPGRQIVRAVFWNRRSSGKPWPMVAGRYEVRAEVSTYKGSAAELARGANQALGPATLRSSEFVATDAERPRAGSTPSAPAPSAADTMRAIAATAPENLAAAFLTNRNRLELLDAFDPDSNSKVTLVFGGEVVTRANVAQMRARFQERQQAYAAEIKRRGVPQVAGKYRFEEAESCRSATSSPIVVYLVQSGFSIDMRRDTADGAHLNSGVATGGTLTLGHGDFSPDLYAYGSIEATGRVVLRRFAAAGCPVVMTPVLEPGTPFDTIDQVPLP
jgi:hypothetical protein